MGEQNVHNNASAGGAAQTIAAMDEYQRACIGQQTYYFVRRILHNPVLRELHAQKKAELQASGYFDRLNSLAPPERETTNIPAL